MYKIYNIDSISLFVMRIENILSIVYNNDRRNEDSSDTRYNLYDRKTLS